MKILGLKILEKFSFDHADVRDQLVAWKDEVSLADWKSPNEIKEKYNSVSFLNDNLIIFNVKGNKYRLAVKVYYNISTILIKKI
jgi:mRNA interferase HigB